MGRKITMTGKNAQYIERRGANTIPDNDREILMEGDEAVYQEIAGGTQVAEIPESKILVQGDYVQNKHQETNNTLNVVSNTLNVTSITLTPGRQSILEQLLDYADKGDWASGVTSEDVKMMLKTVLGLGESPLTGKEAEMSETLWKLLESGRSERLRVIWQNMIGFYDDRHLLKQKSAPALNVDFFGDKDGSDNINKGRPSRDNMSSGFREVLPLLDAYVPKLDKKA